VGDQFHKFFIVPLATATGSISPIVIVIDDLDALDFKDEKKFSTCKALLNCLADASRSLPKYVKIFVTSCPEQDVSERLAVCSSISTIPLELQSPETKVDIRMYTGHLLGQQIHYCRLGASWPGESALLALVT
jgi:hypothetical protein